MPAAPLLLIADPDPDAREILRLTFAHAGYPVITVATWGELLAQLETQPIDLLLSETVFPDRPAGTDDAWAALRARHAIPTVLYTSRVSPWDPSRAATLGVTDWVPKPQHLATLVAIVRRALGQPDPPGRA